jgi:hypothetical protein
LRPPARGDDRQCGEPGRHAIAGAAHKIQVSRSTAICPDLALVTVATGKLWLAVEIISRTTITPTRSSKRSFTKNPRAALWMVDPRYDNVEIYHSTEWGLALKGILAGSEVLTENLIPEFQLSSPRCSPRQPGALISSFFA